MLLDSDSDEEDDDEEESTIYTGTTSETTEPSVSAGRRKSVALSQSQNKGQITVGATSAVQAENLGYVWERNGDKVGLGFARNTAEKIGGVAASARCSVSEDVLAAWGSLGGWRDVST